MESASLLRLGAFLLGYELSGSWPAFRAESGLTPRAGGLRIKIRSTRFNPPKRRAFHVSEFELFADKPDSSAADAGGSA
jgi:hypothetical protein